MTTNGQGLSWLSRTDQRGEHPMPSLALADLDLPLPRWEGSTVVVEPAAPGPGNWAGAPTAVYADGFYYLSYRLRRPVGEGRGYANVIARSADGVTFETICTLDRDAFGAESLERPALVRTPEGRWRIYVSCATPGTAHWWVDVIEAADPASFDPANRRTAFPGSAEIAVKDPVVRWRDGQWHLWASCHPLDEDENTDRMVIRYATSADAVSWQWQATALTGQPGTWDARGVRPATVLPDKYARALLPGLAPDGIVMYYDGRATAAENWEERTGVAIGRPDALFAIGDTPAAQSPTPLRGLRYADVIATPDGCRIYYEATRVDGSHELRTEILPAPAPRAAALSVSGVPRAC